MLTGLWRELPGKVVAVADARGMLAWFELGEVSGPFA